ncbi:type IV secretory system conjugative DNA transfer family protein [Microlunatus ginsengisoli]|uniref:TraD/TraG TraM recognition site domain-containing protein n=1 Tax=Microlunatus ginsengisoli TaxID=363863 RepID=A0ABP6ZNH5_9ACTN
MWAWYTADDKRSATAIAALIVAMIITAEAAVPVAGGMVAMLLTGGGLITSPPGRWPAIIAGVLADPADPAHAFGAVFPVWLYWTVTVLLGVGVLVAGCWAGRVFYRLTAPTGTGFATRAHVARELSPAACRRRAKITRPDLTRRGRARAAAGQVGIPLHQAPVTGASLWLPLENATGVIAPQQSGKTLTDLIHKVLHAPAGLMVTSTKLDLFLLTASARQRTGSRVWLLDLTGAATWPTIVRWSPIHGCTTVKAAKRRAQALVHATTGGNSDDSGNHRFFERRAVDVLTAYLLAAALSGASIPEFVGWCQNDTNTDAADILRQHPDLAAVRRTLLQAQTVVDETRSGIWETLRDAIGCLTDPDLARTTLPHPEQPGFDPATFIRAGGTLYVVGSDDDAAAQAPLITAFVQDVLDTARRLALTDIPTTGRERLTPPFTAVLDEVASICPLPDLPDTLSDSAGRGVLIHYALQSPAQAQQRWGKAANTLFDNTTALTILGGLKSEDTLKWASLLVGRRLEERSSRQTGRGLGQPDSRHIGHERVDILEPAAIRQIPRGRALLIHRTTPALIVTLIPAWTRPDWTQLHTDATRLRHQTTSHTTEPAPPKIELATGPRQREAAA